MLATDSRFTILFSDVDGRSGAYSRSVGGVFFTDRESWGVHDASFGVEVEGRCEGHKYEFTVRLEGSVVLECDRCLQPMDLPMEFEGVLKVERRAGLTDSFDGEEWTMGDSSEGVDIAPYIRESVYLSLPMRHYHGMEGTLEEDCNPEMLARLGGEAVEGEGKLGELFTEELAEARRKLLGQ
ncbi:MAG: hypothetical protein CSA97_01450 [Bacteroidetes bacterium]|nr:MAG: hypothetical protein CSA97_01450 [Bacteroidota bacterium]